MHSGLRWWDWNMQLHRVGAKILGHAIPPTCVILPGAAQGSSGNKLRHDFHDGQAQRRILFYKFTGIAATWLTYCAILEAQENTLSARIFVCR